MVLVALVAVLSFALSLMITYVMPLAAYFSLPTRAWQLAGGALIALTAGQWRRLPERAAAITGWVGLALILFACVYLTPATPYPGTAALLPWLGTALVIGAGCATPTRAAGGSWHCRRCGRSVGGRTRGICGTGRRWCSHRYCWATRSGWPAMWWRSSSLVGLAVLTLRFIENPLRYAASLRRSAGKSLAVGGLAPALAVCVSVVLLLWVSSVPLPIPVGRGAPAAPLTITRGPVPAGHTIGPTTRRCRTCSRKCRPRSRHLPT